MGNPDPSHSFTFPLGLTITQPLVGYSQTRPAQTVTIPPGGQAQRTFTWFDPLAPDYLQYSR